MPKIKLMKDEAEELWHKIGIGLSEVDNDPSWEVVLWFAGKEGMLPCKDRVVWDVPKEQMEFLLEEAENFVDIWQSNVGYSRKADCDKELSEVKKTLNFYKKLKKKIEKSLQE